MDSISPVLNRCVRVPLCSANAPSLSRCSLSTRSLRYAVLGAGFAGLSVAWHLLKDSPDELSLHVDIYDEAGIGGGASGVSGGLLHPYSPKAKLLWRGDECWKESLKLISVAETAYSTADPNVEATDESHYSFGRSIVQKRGILRPATNKKILNLMNDNAQDSLGSCKIDSIDKNAAQALVPNLRMPLDLAFYMPEAMNVNPKHYLQALFQACQNIAKASPKFGFGGKHLTLHRKSISSLRDLEEGYNAVVICLGSKVDCLPELTGKLPLRTCRGIIAHMQLSDSIEDPYPDHGPSILSDAWLAIQSRSSLLLGSTWDWRSKNYSSKVSESEASQALDELLPKASAVYPSIKKWSFRGARAGLRAMPPLTPHGSLPLLGCVDDLVGGNHNCKYWLFGGLGSRGLLYHAWLGKLMTKAVIFSDEDFIPSELTSWKQMKQP